jgi:hypothetical protein
METLDWCWPAWASPFSQIRYLLGKVGSLSSKTVYGNFLYVSLVAILVITLLMIVGLTVGNDVFNLALTLTVGALVILAGFVVLFVAKKALNRRN